MSIYLDKLEHLQVVINCQYSIAQMCTHKDTLSHYLGAPFIDDVIRHNMLITPDSTRSCFFGSPDLRTSRQTR